MVKLYLYQVWYGKTAEMQILQGAPSTVCVCLYIVRIYKHICIYCKSVGMSIAQTI
jgi:hypothetical protein